MKNAMKRTVMLAAAAATLGLAAASAQSTTKFKADIPFDFQIGTQKYEAGSYAAAVKVSTGGLRMLIISQDGGATTMAVPFSSISPKPGETGRTMPKLVFRCAADNCALAQVWTGFQPEGLLFNAPKVPTAWVTRLAVVRLRTLNAD